MPLLVLVVTADVIGVRVHDPASGWRTVLNEARSAIAYRSRCVVVGCTFGVT